MNRAKKKEWIDNFSGVVESANSVIVVKFSGLKVSELEQIRNKAHELGVSVFVTKNTLAKIVLSKSEFSGVENYFGQQNIVFVSSDETAPAVLTKTLKEFGDRIEVISGGFKGQVLMPKDIEELSSIESISVLHAKLLALITSVPASLVSAIKDPAGKIVRLLSAYASK